MSRPSDPYQAETEAPPTEVSERVIEEERGTLSRQYEMMQHIDDRALRITRTSAVLLSIIFAGLSLLLQTNSEKPYLVAPPVPTVAGYVGGTGVALVTTALFVGIVTTQYSRPIYGIGERVRHEIAARQCERKALAELSDEYDDGITVMQSRLERNRQLLWAVQLVFIAGLICLVIGTTLVLNSAVTVATPT